MISAVSVSVERYFQPEELRFFFENGRRQSKFCLILIHLFTKYTTLAGTLFFSFPSTITLFWAHYGALRWF